MSSMKEMLKTLSVTMLAVVCFVGCAKRSSVPAPPARDSRDIQQPAGRSSKTSAVAPLLVVYAEGQLPVETVTVSLTNPFKDTAILVTAVEFDGQLPELRYFLHGIYGKISKKGDSYEHNPMVQQLSMPVGSCFLLPGQSTSWQRPLRIQSGGYEATISWSSIPEMEIATSVWAPSIEADDDTTLYKRLTKDEEALYSNRAAGKVMPYTVVEGNFPLHSITCHVTCVGICMPPEKIPEGFSADSVEFRLPPISDSIIVTKDRVVFRNYNMAEKKYETCDSPYLAPEVIDFLFIQSRSKNQTVPCLLASRGFADLMDVQQPRTNMYYDPGITQVPLKRFAELLSRAKELGLPVDIKRIDPNSLGQKLVITVGVHVDKRGRQTASQRVGVDEHR